MRIGHYGNTEVNWNGFGGVQSAASGETFTRLTKALRVIKVIIVETLLCFITIQNRSKGKYSAVSGSLDWGGAFKDTF